MKKTLPFFAVLALTATNVCAGNGDLIVDGKLGVGAVTNSSFKIDVNGTGRLAQSGDNYLVIDSTDYNSPLLLLRKGNSNNWSIGVERNAPAYGASGNDLVFFDYNGLPGPRIVVKNSTGNVGIGTTTPYTRLHIQGPATAVSGTAKAVVQIADDSAMAQGVGGAITFLGKYTAAGDIIAGGYIQAHKTNSTEEDANFDLAFGTRKNGYGVAEVMRINSEGNVGIGTATPSHKLEIGAGGNLSLDRGYLLQKGNSRSRYYNSANTNYADIYNPSLDNTAPLVMVDGSGQGIKIDGLGNVGIGSQTTEGYRFYVNGLAYSTGGWQGSDVRFKKNFLPITSPLEMVLNLNGLSYEWKTDEYKDKGFPEGRHYGVIAQEIEKVLPEIVRTGSDGTKAVAYTEIIPVLVEAIKEQQKLIEKQRQEIEQIKKLILIK